MKERIKDYRRFHGQKYFRGNTVSRNLLICKLEYRIRVKRIRQLTFSFWSE